MATPTKSSAKRLSTADADAGSKHKTDADPTDVPEPKRSKTADEDQQQKRMEDTTRLSEPPSASLERGETAVDRNGRGGSTPSSILEKGIIYFFFRGRVNVQKPEEVSDIARSYIILRPIEKDAKLGTGPIGDAGNSRLCAIPKKTLPQNGQDRWLALVEKAGVSFSILKEEFLAGSDYQTKTAGERHGPAATPVGEGVYALTTTGSESHLVYMLTIPETLGEVQQEIGLREKGSFVLSTKNPDVDGPPGTSLPKSPEYPGEIVEEFRSLRWLPTQPKHLDYANAQFLLIGESSSGIEKATEPRLKDQKSGKDEPAKELEKLEQEDAKRVKALDDDDAGRIFADLQAHAKDYPKLQTTF